jgi:hypothetical protein
MSRSGLVLPVLVFAGVVAAAPGVAGAAYSYQGSDYSYNNSTRTIMYACDKESDETKVKANYRRASGSYLGNVYDVDGNNGKCASGYTATQYDSRDTVVEHKTCEYRSFWPDECGNWVAA